jgi:Putative zinc-finger
MERAPLRPVPRRPAGPVDPQVAIRVVEQALPALEEPAGPALALVALSGRNRAEAAARLQLEERELAAALAAGRKALRRSLAPLPGSGWCERAELLISDRLDGALDETGSERLQVHLRNCERCVEHERRLVQATDALVSAVGAPSAVPEEQAPPADLRAVQPTAAGAGQIAVLPFGEPVAPGGRQAAGEPDRRLLRLPWALEPRASRQLASTVVWHVLFALAVLLALAAIVIALLSVL